MPSSPVKHDGFSSKDRNNNMRSLFNFKARSSSESSSCHSPPPISKRWGEKAKSRSSMSFTASTPSLRNAPNSILLKYTEKQLEKSDSFEENETKLRQKYAEQLAWVRENGSDFVALESMKSVDEISALLFAMAENKSPTLLQLRMSCNETITVSYQFLDKFKQEFMMLKVCEGYYMFMAPF